MREPSESPSDLGSEVSPAQNGGGAPPVALGRRRLFAIAVFAAILGLGITLSFGYADHHPRPHGVRIAVAAAPAVRAHVAAGLERAQRGGFDVVGVGSAQAAARSVRSQSTAGALIVPASGHTTIVTAGAEGVTQKQALTNALTATSAAVHRNAEPLDLAPLPAGDSTGLSSFVFGLGLLLPGRKQPRHHAGDTRAPVQRASARVATHRPFAISGRAATSAIGPRRPPRAEFHFGVNWDATPVFGRRDTTGFPIALLH